MRPQPLKQRSVPAKRAPRRAAARVAFHYTATLHDEYRTLFHALQEGLNRGGFEFSLHRRGYDESTLLTTVEQLLNEDTALSIVELPIATTARLLMEPGRKGRYQVVGSSFTFTSERPKLAVCTLSRDPQRQVRRLLCAARDSVVTQLARYYAATRRWDLPAISANTQELGSYARLLDVVETICGAPQAELVLGDCAFVLSGQRHLERMEALAEATRDRLHFRIGYDLYADAKENVRRALFGYDAAREMPDLPGSLLVARADADPLALGSFMGIVDRWGEVNEVELRGLGMARPHVGTPAPVVGTVVFMEQIAQALEGAGEPLATLDYDDFILAPTPAKWLLPAVRREAVDAIRAAATHLLASVMDAERSAAEDFERYFLAANRRQQPPALRFHAMREALAELAVFFSGVVRALPQSSGTDMKDRIVALRGRVHAQALRSFVDAMGDRYGAAFDVRELAPQVIRAAFDAIVAIKRDFRTLVQETGLTPTPRAAFISGPDRQWLTVSHPDRPGLTLRLDLREYASKQLTAPGKAPLLRMLFFLLQHGEATTKALVREALGFEPAHDLSGRVLGRQGKRLLKSNTFYSYCQRLREFFPFVQSNHKGSYTANSDAAHGRVHAEDLVSLRRK